MKRWLVMISTLVTLLLPGIAHADTIASNPANGQPFVQSATFQNSQPGSVQQVRFGRSGGYHSGYRSYSAPSYSRPSYGYSGGYGGYAPRSSFGSHLFSFGAGWMLGSMFHPFGGYYGYGGPMGYHSFSIFGLLFDLFILWILWRIIRGFFRR